MKENEIHLVNIFFITGLIKKTWIVIFLNTIQYLSPAFHTFAVCTSGNLPSKAHDIKIKIRKRFFVNHLVSHLRKKRELWNSLLSFRYKLRHRLPMFHSHMFVWPSRFPGWTPPSSTDRTRCPSTRERGWACRPCRWPPPWGRSLMMVRASSSSSTTSSTWPSILSMSSEMWCGRPAGPFSSFCGSIRLLRC